MPAHIAGEVLERRDLLLRSLARDHTYSFKTIASSLRSAAADERELEILLVVAARALGFVASHVSNSHNPDGVARFTDYSQGEKKIILEAKSSKEVPALGAIDFAGLHEHMLNEGAHGCLLVSPGYPGSAREEDAAAANRAKQQKISCWTVAQLARFIEAAESRYLNANHLLDIVLNHFSPLEVEAAIDTLLSEETSDYHALYGAIVQALKVLEPTFRDTQRTVEMVATAMALVQPEFAGVGALKRVRDAIRSLSMASQGAMQLRGKNILLYVSLDELERRVAGLTKQSGEPRRLSNFRKS